MNLRCVFHIHGGPQASTVTAKPAPRASMPSLLDLDIEFVDEPELRGRSAETWSRARGWASED
jgi:hypothetical protein